MTPGTRPRIIFLLVAPTPYSPTAEKDTRAVGGPDRRWTRREEQDASTQEAARGPFLRFMEAMPLSGFPAKHTLCHPCPDQPLPIRTKRRPRPVTGTEALPGLALSTFFKQALLRKKKKRLRNSVLHLKTRGSLKPHYLAHC